MGHKIFVSYKYKDTNVESLPNVLGITAVHHYVDYIQEKILNDDDDIYKGEKSDEDISNWSDNAIWEHLKNKIYDSTLTIVLISPNMKEPGKWQKSQWIPWEISYSVKKMPRNERTSQRNALLAVILPNRYGSYNYYDKNDLFPILRDNIDNGYTYVVKWNEFKKCPSDSINEAYEHQENTSEYKIVKSL